VSAGHERGYDELDFLPLAVDDSLDVVQESVGEHGRLLKAIRALYASRLGRFHFPPSIVGPLIAGR
jgi:hypothetical protein